MRLSHKKGVEKDIMATNKKVVFIAFGLCFFGMLFFWNFRNASSPINWANRVSEETLNDSWETWKTYFSRYNLLIKHDDFLWAAKNGEYQMLSIEDFLALNVEDHQRIDYRCAQHGYLKAGAAAFPFCHEKDIQSVKYFLKTTLPVSPVVVVRVHEKDFMRYVKLDGSHRLAAAIMKKSPIKVLFLDL